MSLRTSALSVKTALLSSLLVVSGCATLQSLALPPQDGTSASTPAAPPPTATFAKESVADRSLASSTVDLVYTLQNPAPTQASVAAVHYTLSVEGHPAFDGAPKATLTLPASGSSELHLTAPVTFADLGLPADATQARYTGKGTVDFQTASGIVTVPFEHSGTLVVPQKPTFSVSLPSIASVAFPSASLTVPVKVKNPNDFPITLTNLSGDVSVLGSAIGHVARAEHAQIAPGAEASTQLSVDVPYLTLVTAALAKKVPEIGFTGQLETGPVQVPVTFTQAIPMSLSAPQVTMGIPRIQHVGFTEATLVFPFEVKNPNVLPLPLGAINGALNVSGAEVGKVATNALGLVPAGQGAHVEVPLTVELLGAAKSVLASGPVSVGFHGNVGAASASLPIDFTQQLTFQR